MLGDPKVWKQLGDKKAYVEGGSGSVMLGCVGREKQENI